MKASFGRLGTIIAVTGLFGVTNAAAQDRAFGDDESVAFADALWRTLQDAQLIGDEVIRSRAYEGNEPHGAILEQTETELAVEDSEGTVIVKHNYMAEGESLTPERVMSAQWDEYLAAVTVMFRREQGYNPDAGNWFWAKYLPDGSLDQTPDGRPMAGRVPGCIQCHQSAEGGDFVFMHDRFARD